MSAADRERIEAIPAWRHNLRVAVRDLVERMASRKSRSNLLAAIDEADRQLSALSEALSAAQEEIEKLKATTT